MFDSKNNLFYVKFHFDNINAIE